MPALIQNVSLGGARLITPEETGAAGDSLLLLFPIGRRQRGLTRVKPLLGGIDAWRARGYPLEAVRVDEADRIRLPEDFRLRIGALPVLSRRPGRGSNSMITFAAS